ALPISPAGRARIPGATVTDHVPTRERDAGAPDGAVERAYDSAGVERAVRDLLRSVGEDPDRPGLRDTPARMARAFAEIFAGLRQDPEDVVQTFFDIDHEEMVIVRD